MDGLSSTFNLTTRALVAYFSATASTVGVNIRHGAHQAAQKSTNTGLSDCKTSFSKLPSLTSATCSFIINSPSFVGQWLSQINSDKCPILAFPITARGLIDLSYLLVELKILLGDR